jgi:hypothetical protein
MELPMPEIENQDMEQESPIQKWAPYLVLIVLGGAVAFYLTQFPNGLSDKQSVWGQFGDFVGGLVNPIIGFFTIWLLAVSLRQNHKALRQANAALEQAKAELELTRIAIDDARKMQAATETALKEQTAIAASTRDISNAITLWKNYEESYTERLKRRDAIPPHKRDQGNGFALLVELGRIKGRIDKLEPILEKELNRLLEGQSPAEHQ